ncbi:MAG TPA: gamma-glutamyl-gamma-aminobutyrate hydrolase family protein [bacterium]|nr:gamma-glutamyl-gamma-aminobutyrate hydrolase family protein [bacterium]
MGPIIGISCASIVESGWGRFSPGHRCDLLDREYSSAIQELKACPILIPNVLHGKTLKDVMDLLDGLLISGGTDVNPCRYGEDPLPGLGEIDAPRDECELAQARMALDRDLPLLGICRGMQVLNVAAGGTLFQDMQTQIPNSLKHRQDADKEVLTHRVAIEKKTLLYGILQKETLSVNGKHHQAVKDLGAGLTISAKAPDGVIEGIENPGSRFVVGVQWHPEGNWKEDSDSMKIFAAFVSAARVGARRGALTGKSRE